MQVEVCESLLSRNVLPEWQNQLGCLITHLSIFRGREDVIENAKRVQNCLISPVESVQQALEATGDGSWCFKPKLRLTVTIIEKQNFMRNVEESFSNLYEIVNTFWLSNSSSPYQYELWLWGTVISVRIWAVGKNVVLTRDVKDGLNTVSGIDTALRTRTWCLTISWFRTLKRR